MIHAIRVYCEQFYEWKKNFELRKHWQVYKRGKCKICNRKLKREKLGAGKRSTFYCAFCQSKRLSKDRVFVHKVLPIPPVITKEKPLDH